MSWGFLTGRILMASATIAQPPATLMAPETSAQSPATLDQQQKSEAKIQREQYG